MYGVMCVSDKLKDKIGLIVSAWYIVRVCVYVRACIAYVIIIMLCNRCID